ncbi:hypothetical protein SM19410_13230 [Xanthomonas hortorum pv. gardneri]|nr:hypothetical protein SM19410_13230 [Xanthomonas hortorum pv. gardneri]KLB24512.1 hypothetical protein SM41311_06565 [Xanthomonas hortorum pv. gardneri]KLB28660.1 hypothetical protein SM77512_13380 [Xanthomonas hortorum pv. gardneri]KLB34632.1 hypothetical protein SM79512_14480 [Xanthomonas hortorum pv. gardneri]
MARRLTPGVSIRAAWLVRQTRVRPRVRLEVVAYDTPRRGSRIFGFPKKKLPSGEGSQKNQFTLGFDPVNAPIRTSHPG